MRRTTAVSLSLAACLTVTACRPETGTQAPVSSGAADQFSGTVTSVADGDTITIGATHVRLLGIDAPEVAHGSSRAACGGDAARRALDALVWRHFVTVTTDARADARDRFGRVLGYVTINGQDAGAYMVERGFAEAWHPARATPPTHYRAYLTAERAAKANHVGNWVSCSTQGRPRGGR